jgi:hypothetical protein
VDVESSRRRPEGARRDERRASSSPAAPYPELVHRLSLVASVLTLCCLAAAPTRAGEVPNWDLQLRVDRWVAPSSFAATVTGQTAGLRVRRGLRVTLRLDRRTRCAERDAAGALVTIRCAEIRPRLTEEGSLAVRVTGQFETGHLGAIGFRSRTLTLL